MPGTEGEELTPGTTEQEGGFHFQSTMLGNTGHSVPSTELDLGIQNPLEKRLSERKGVTDKDVAPSTPDLQDSLFNPISEQSPKYLLGS